MIVRILISCAVAIVALSVQASSQSGGAFPNVRIFPGAVTQTEPVAAIHPTNPSMIFASAVTIDTRSGIRSEGVYVSTDGGQHWFGSDTCNGALLVNHGGDPGVAIDTNGRLILTHIGEQIGRAHV
jgi:hypothetical protein